MIGIQRTGRCIAFVTVMLLAETTSVASEPQQKSTTGEIGDRAQMAAIEKLRLVVRSKGYAESRNRMLREANQDENQIVSEPFTASIETVLVSDEGSGSKLIDTGHLADMGIGSDLALILGKKQALSGLPPLPSSADFGSGVVISPQIDYVASMLLASGWDDLDASLSGRLVAAVPSDDQIMLANITSDAMYEKFKLYVSSAYDEANRSVSKALLFRKDGRWVETE